MAKANPRIARFVADLVAKDPKLLHQPETVKETVLKRISGRDIIGLKDMSVRRFHGMYTLQLARKAAIEHPRRQRRRRRIKQATPVAREGVRQILLHLASDLLSAEGPDIIDVVDAISSQDVDRIVLTVGAE